MKRITGRGVLAAVAALGLLAPGCGTAGGGSPKDPDHANLYARSFSHPNYSGVRLDEDVTLRVSSPVAEGSINPDSIQIRTGATGGVAPFGVFVRGVFAVDTSTGNRIVIDEDQLTPNLILRFERTGNFSRISDGIRIDLGANSLLNGVRKPLFDRSREAIVTFVPEVPTRVALDDTGYLPASTYTVAVPAYPSTNTLTNVAGDSLQALDNRVFTSSFTTVPATAPALFLGGEGSGVPRVIGTDPANGIPNVLLDSRLRIWFSQALDPRTVVPAQFKVEIVSMLPPYTVIPVSVFLGQQRLGKCEVTLTPVSPLPSNAIIRVTLNSGIEDLVGQALTQSIFSFSTGPFGTIEPPDLDEEFVDVLTQDSALTTANWNNSRPYVGGVAGELTAAFAPYAGDGTDGAFSAPVGVVTTLSTGTSIQRVYNYTTFTVPIGATVIASGNYPLVVHCQGAVDVSGTLQASGQRGNVGFTGNGSQPTVANGGAGGSPGAGGAAGGDGAFTVIGGGGNFDGVNGVAYQTSAAAKGGFTGDNESVYKRKKANATDQVCSSPSNSNDQCRNREAGGGGGRGASGANAGNFLSSGLSRDGASVANGGVGGNSFGSPIFSDASINATVQVKDPNSAGLRNITLNGIPTLVALQGGSGGGGGGGEDDIAASVNGTAGNEDEGGGGGGGGGGAIQIISYTNVTISGAIRASGGAGGNSSLDPAQSDFGQGSGGGGGSGGAIWVQCRGTVTVNSGSVVQAVGGAGGSGYSDGTTTVFVGGTGGAGIIRFEDGDGIVSQPAGVTPTATTGTFTPLLDLDSVAWCNWQNTLIFTPKFPDPIIDADVFPSLPFNGTIRIYLEGAPENVGTVAIEDPDTTNSTGLIKVYDSTTGGLVAGASAALNNNKWWRFKVVFHVDGFHTFSDPMPTVRRIFVEVTP